MSADKLYRNYYEQPQIRTDNCASQQRTSVTLGMMPGDVRSVLDVGCGEGYLLGKLDMPRKTGTDISRHVLLKTPFTARAQASGDALPFSDRSFDCVLCTEVLEHLPHPVLNKTASELMRVSSKYLLVSVPFMEDIARKQARCIKCGTAYHIHMHLRAFSLDKLSALFPAFETVDHHFSGPLEITWPSWLLKIRHIVGNRWEWDKGAFCPSCGTVAEGPPPRTAISAVTSLLGDRLGRRHPKWISVLFRKRSQG